MLTLYRILCFIKDIFPTENMCTYFDFFHVFISYLINYVTTIFNFRNNITSKINK